MLPLKEEDIHEAYKRIMVRLAGDISEVVQKVRNNIEGELSSGQSQDLAKCEEEIIAYQKRILELFRRKREGRRLTGITGSTYQYNSEGIRTKKITPNETTTFELEGSNIISMNKETSTENVRLDFVYDASATLIGVNTIEGHYFYIRDITGNILGLIDNEGNYIVKYKYDAWGKVLEKKICESCIASRHNPFVYKGYFLDEETGFYYLKSRYYDPVIRSFISIDSPQYIDQEDLPGLNLYAYCGNNPVMYTDSTGTSPWTDFWNGVGNWFSNHWVELTIGAAFIIGGAVVTALTAGTGTGFWTAFGAAALTSLKATAISTAISVGVGGLVSVAGGGGFFDNFGDSLASGFMWGGIFSGGAQMLSCGFKIAAQHGFKGFGSTLSPDRLRGAKEIAKIAGKGQSFYIPAADFSVSDLAH